MDKQPTQPALAQVKSGFLKALSLVFGLFGLFILVAVTDRIFSSSPAKTAMPSPSAIASVPEAAAPAPIALPPLDLKKPLFTVNNAILCSLDSFENPQAGYSVADVQKAVEDRTEEREYHAHLQDCQMWQPDVSVKLLPTSMHEGITDLTRLAHYTHVQKILQNPGDWVVLLGGGTDPSFPCCWITRRDQLHN